MATKKSTKKTAAAVDDTSKPVPMKTYILDLQNGDTRRVTVPASWKTTFGPTIPFSGKGSVPYGQGTALRLYEGKSKSDQNLRAVFTDVKAFRDSSIEIRERRTDVQRQVVAKNDGGGAHNVVIEARVTEWVNPDDDAAMANKSAPYVASMPLPPAYPPAPSYRKAADAYFEQVQKAE